MSQPSALVQSGWQGDSPSSVVTVTIGIPAFNEENLIHFLLQQATSQRENSTAHVSELLVLSDGSNYGAEDVVRMWLTVDRTVRLYTHKNRERMSARVNDIFSLANGVTVPLRHL